MGGFQLAQANISTGRWPFDHWRMRGFASRIDVIDGLAREAPGFVWRPSPEAVMSDLVRLGLDPMREAYNLSVWESVESLWAFTFGGVHLDAVKRSARWFEPDSAFDVMWWVPAGHRPTTEEGLAKLALVKEAGPTPEGFTFRKRFPPPGLP
ncbi:DUF3291 domain-containing protein [Lentzea sp. DG1S-22]|uniref:DUF3291 domain-containing protein n=1 Tax=Lentzea sp. DG1S-22 TaxID=3108822 RepID=UPI002E7A7969|nr:DUF3291 domain-containing protein [Lentzea sp. DG1S-22]WVH83353.1 DUF3291 domain-containing protein [Lentzea sp. DG1S-22]